MQSNFFFWLKPFWLKLDNICYAYAALVLLNGCSISHFLHSYKKWSNGSEDCCPWPLISNSDRLLLTLTCFYSLKFLGGKRDTSGFLLYSLKINLRGLATDSCELYTRSCHNDDVFYLCFGNDQNYKMLVNKLSERQLLCE